MPHGDIQVKSYLGEGTQRAAVECPPSYTPPLPDASRAGGGQMADGAESIWEGSRAFTLGLLAACRSAWLPEVNLPSSPSARLTAASQNTAAVFGQFPLQNSFISPSFVQRDIASAGVCVKAVWVDLHLPGVSVRFLCSALLLHSGITKSRTGDWYRRPLKH